MLHGPKSPVVCMTLVAGVLGLGSLSSMGQPPRGVTAASSAGLYGELYGLAVVSPSDVWAVGTGDGRTLTEHWDGSTWTRVPSPSPYKGAVDTLTGVTAVSSRDVWAVGAAQTENDTRAFIEHWNGTRWSVVPVPHVEGETFKELFGVSGVAADDVWAVGDYSTVTTHRTLILHWDGSAWSHVSSPSPFPHVGAHLLGVSAVSADDVWAAGYFGNRRMQGRNLVVHWDGHVWSRASIPDLGGANDGLVGVSASSADEVWSVGVSVSPRGHQRATTQHFDGARWVDVPNVNPDGDLVDLSAVSARSHHDAWAVGIACKKNDCATFTEHWGGSSWRRVASPGPDGSYNALNGVVTVSAGDAWAVGSTGDWRSTTVLILHWDGTRWTRV